jgi:hypothetical protein
MNTLRSSNPKVALLQQRIKMARRGQRFYVFALLTVCAGVGFISMYDLGIAGPIAHALFLVLTFMWGWGYGIDDYDRYEYEAELGNELMKDLIND